MVKLPSLKSEGETGRLPEIKALPGESGDFSEE
jgi:hypothetical protein